MSPLTNVSLTSHPNCRFTPSSLDYHDLMFIHSAPLVWSTVNAAEGKIEGWNVERGVTSDFVLGAHFALEDEGYVPFFENHFYKSGKSSLLLTC